MGNYSEAHIFQCLTLLSTLRRNSAVTITGNRQKTGEEFVGGVMYLAQGLLQLGLCSGDVISIAAFNRFKIPKIFIPWKKPFPATTTGKIRRDQVRGEAVFHLQHLNSNL